MTIGMIGKLTLIKGGFKVKRKKFYQLDGVCRNSHNLIIDLANNCSVAIYGPKVFFVCWFFTGNPDRIYKAEVYGTSVSNFYLDR